MKEKKKVIALLALVLVLAIVGAIADRMIISNTYKVSASKRPTTVEELTDILNGVDPEAEEPVIEEEPAEEELDEEPVAEEEPAEEEPAEEQLAKEPVTEEEPAEEEPAEEAPAEEPAAEEEPADVNAVQPKQMMLILAEGQTGANMYTAPDLTADVICELTNNDPVLMEQFDETWSLVDVNGVKGYVENRFLVMMDNGDMTEEEKEVFRSVSVKNDLDGQMFAISGLPYRVTAVLTGFEDTEYSVQWQYSLDGVNYIDIPGANGLSYTYIADSETIRYYWCVVITTPDPTVETE